MPFTIDGSTALVTGANRGIGTAITEALLAAGAGRVYAAVRRIDSADHLLDAHGERVVPVRLDLTEPGTIIAAAERAADVDLVVNNAGALKIASPLESSAIEALRQEIEVNVNGLLRMAQAFAAVLKANGGGAFVQLNSVASLKSFPAFGTYCASKAASYSLTQALREQFAAQGTQVVSVHPGPIATDMADAAGMRDMAEAPEVVAEAIIACLESGEFHCFPDSMAREIGQAYRGFAEAVIEAEQASS